MFETFPSMARPAEFPPGTVAQSPMYLRYEDVTMDGHLTPLAAPAALATIWREVLRDHPGARNAMMSGIVPILTRLTIHTGDRPIRVDHMVDVLNGFVLAHDRQGDEITRLFMNMWCEIDGVGGRLGPFPPSGERVRAATVFAEHTFTRPLAPPDQRRVTQLVVDGYPPVPELHYRQPAVSSAADAPDGATWLEELAPDPLDFAFTLDQTDSNQHVNSLVYIRVFAEAVNRRLAATKRPLRARTRAVDIGYRKPCFAGDSVRVHLRLFQLGTELGAAGKLVGADGKDRCYVRVVLGT
jgi:hypothetical protein